MFHHTSYIHTVLSPVIHSLLVSCLFIGHTNQLVGSWFLDQGLNSSPLQWKNEALTTGKPGNFLYSPHSFLRMTACFFYYKGACFIMHASYIIKVKWYIARHIWAKVCLFFFPAIFYQSFICVTQNCHFSELKQEKILHNIPLFWYTLTYTLGNSIFLCYTSQYNSGMLFKVSNISRNETFKWIS